MSGSYGVDSLHLNVGDGECTVHLLVRGDPTPAATKTIVKAILVDAGPANAARFGSHILSSSFASIAARYGCSVLQFDAVVLSVWQPDYYGGFFELLNDDIGDNSKVPDGSHSTAVRPSWLKYDTKGKPLSTVYAPCAPPSHVPELKLDTPESGLVYARLRPGAGQPATISQFCKFVCGRRELLGRDLFAGAGPLTFDFLANPVVSPYALLEKNPPAANMPGLYCVVAEDIVMGSQTPVTSRADPSLSLVVMWNSKPACISYYGGSVADDCVQNDLVDWVTAAPPNAEIKPLSVTSMKVGGRSGGPVTVAEAVDGLGPQSLVMFTGSKHSNPRWELILLLHTLLMSQRPDVATSKSIYATQYPYYFIKEASSAGGSNYVDFSATGQLSYDSFVRPGPENANFLQKLDEFYSRVNKRLERLGQPGLLNVHDEYCLWGEDKAKPRSERESRDWITDQCERRWAEISPITAQSHPAAGAAVHGSLMNPVGAKGVVEYICVESRDAAAAQGCYDGAVWIKYLGGCDLQSHQNSGPKSVATLRSIKASETPASAPASAPTSSDPTPNIAAGTPAPGVVPSPPQVQFSQFPSWSQDRNDALGQRSFDQTTVLTTNGLYSLESLLEPPADSLEVLAQHTSCPTAPSAPLWVHNDPRMQARLADSRESKTPAAITKSAIDNELCIASTLLVRGGAALGKPSVLRPGEADTFVGSLHNARLDLAEKPVVASAGLAQAYCEFAKSDELYGWFAASVGATSLQLAPSATQKIAQLRLKLTDGLEFGTENTAHVFGSDVAAVLSKEMGGLVSPQNVLVLAMDPKCKAGEVELSELVSLPVAPAEKRDTDLQRLLAIPLTLDTEPGNRSAIWFEPERSYRTVRRLQYSGDAQGAATITDVLASRIPGLVVTKVKVVNRRTSTWVVTSRGQSALQDVQTDLILDCTLRLPASEGAVTKADHKPDLSAQVVVRINKDRIKVDVNLNSGDLLATLLSWLAAQAGSLDLAALLDGEMAKKMLARTPQPRRVSLTIPVDAKGNLGQISALSVDLELLAKAGSPGSNDSVLFLFTYTWGRTQESSLRGSLWLKPPGSRTDTRRLLPDWEEALELVPLNNDCYGEYLDLKALAQPHVLPTVLPSRITEATIEVKNTGWAFGGAVSSSPPTDKNDKTQVYLGKLGVRVMRSWKSGAEFVAARLDIDVGLLRAGVIAKDDKPARIRGAVVYDGLKKTWLMGALIKNFDLAYLYSLFATHTREALTVLLCYVRVSYLVLALEDVEGMDMGIQMAGGIKIGGADFDLAYTRGQPPGGQTNGALNPFRKEPAQIGPRAELVESEIFVSTPGHKDASDPPTLEEFLNVFVKPLMLHSRDTLPDFLRSIRIGAIKVTCRTVVDSAKNRTVCLVGSMMVNGLEFVLIVIRDPGSGSKSHMKIMLKAVLPSIPPVPLGVLGDLNIPIDEIYLAFVFDMPPKPYATDVTKMVGLTVGELALINKAIDQLKMKELIYWVYKDNMDMKDVAILAGGHVVIVGIDATNKPLVVLDYIFATPKVAKKVIRSDEKDGSTDTKGSGNKADDKGDGKPDTKDVDKPKVMADTKADASSGAKLSSAVEDTPKPQEESSPGSKMETGDTARERAQSATTHGRLAGSGDKEPAKMPSAKMGGEGMPPPVKMYDPQTGNPVNPPTGSDASQDDDSTAEDSDQATKKTKTRTRVRAKTAPGLTGSGQGSNSPGSNVKKTDTKTGTKTEAQADTKPGDKAESKPDVKQGAQKDGKYSTAKKTPSPPMQVMPYKKDTESFVLANIGIKYQDNTLTIFLDAKALLGFLQASMTGLWVAVTFDRESSVPPKVEDTKEKGEGKKTSGEKEKPLLDKLTVKRVRAGFKGIAAAINRPPLIIAIAFYLNETAQIVLRPDGTDKAELDITGGHDRPDNYDPEDLTKLDLFKTARHDDLVKEDTAWTCAGGGIVSFTTWRFTLAGLYESRKHKEYRVVVVETAQPAVEGQTRTLALTADPSKSSSSSTVFLFVKWEGRIQLSALAITGIMFALGHNLKLRWPQVEEVKDFPLVGMHRAAVTPTNQLRDLTAPRTGGWIMPQDGESFVALGLKIDVALKVAVDVAAIVQWAPEFRLALVGVAVCELPSAQSPIKLGRIEVGFMASLLLAAGSFSLQAAISPESFVFHESCHLRGGLALCFWWPVSAAGQVAARNEGDFVLSIGGYHKSFAVPAHYPSVDRLALDWRVSDAIAIHGEVYFALTPRAVMLGLMVSLTFRLGNLSAWFNAWLDVLMNLDQVRYVITGGVTVGVNYTHEVFWVSTNVSAQIGAQFRIEGQPFGGRARVEFWIFTFDIEFGDASREPEFPRSLAQFYDLVLGVENKSAPKDKDSGVRSTVNFNATAGLIAPAASSSKEGEKEEEKEEGRKEKPWNVRSGLFAFSIGCSFPISTLLVDDRAVAVPTQEPLYGKPMKKSDVAISSELHVRVFKKNFRNDGSLDPAYEKLAWDVVPTTKALPKGLWEKYDESKDPALSENNTSALNETSDVSISLTSGVVLTAPPPHVSPDSLLPIRAGELQKEEALDAGAPRCFPGHEMAHARAAPALVGAHEEHYAKAAGVWTASRKEVPALLDYWAQSLFWGERPGGGGALDASPPKMYIGKRERLWMGAPAITAAA